MNAGTVKVKYRLKVLLIHSRWQDIMQQDMQCAQTIGGHTALTVANLPQPVVIQQLRAMTVDESTEC